MSSNKTINGERTYPNIKGFRLFTREEVLAEISEGLDILERLNEKDESKEEIVSENNNNYSDRDIDNNFGDTIESAEYNPNISSNSNSFAPVIQNDSDIGILNNIVEQNNLEIVQN